MAQPITEAGVSLTAKAETESCVRADMTFEDVRDGKA
jgi:hypothetical protein